MNFLEDIIDVKKREVGRLHASTTLESLKDHASSQPSPLGFLKKPKGHDPLALIAEVKKASPSKGDIQVNADPATVASHYDAGGTDAISVLTDEHFFKGSIQDFQEVRVATNKPLLRKDFIIDEWQVYEARAIGADAVLLIAAILDERRMQILYDLARSLNMSVLLEIHQKEELNILNSLSVPQYIGINNRNLNTFQVDLATTEILVPLVQERFPDAMIISESGISTNEDAIRVKQAGAHGLLVGESLMRRGLEHIHEAIASLKNGMEASAGR